MKFSVQHQVIPQGKVSVSGAKNAATRLLAAALLTDEKVTLLNFPTELLDARHKCRFIEAMGGRVNLDQEKNLALIESVELDPAPLSCYDFPIRTTYLLAAGQIRKNGKAWIPYPGGCKLGERKYDLHLMVWRKFGCEVTENADHIFVKGTLTGANIRFPISTVGGTENAILCGSIAQGYTIIHNAYVTPEIENLIEGLTLMGANIKTHGRSRIEIQGVPNLRGASINIIPDRIEALTWMVLAAITKGSIEIENIPFQTMEIPLIHLREAGVDFYRNKKSVKISPSTIDPSGVQPFELACGTHPGIISDMQPFFVLLALNASGRSLVFDYRYPERTAYLKELQKMYPHALKFGPGKIEIFEPSENTEQVNMTSTDLRGSMAMIMAALSSKKPTTVEKSEMAFRGYNYLEEKLRGLGFMFDLLSDSKI